MSFDHINSPTSASSSNLSPSPSPQSLDSDPSPIISAPLSISAPTPEPITIVSNHNDHPMVTRGKTGNLKPRVFLTQLEPKTVKQALGDSRWLTAMKAEYQALMHNHT
jgi:hypothetical protein